MPQLSSPLSSPAGMPLVNSAHIAKAGGLFMVFATVSDLAAGVAAEAAGWPDGQLASVSEEAGTGAVRVYRTSLGHARTVQIGSAQIELSDDSNLVRVTSGTPGSGTGSNGDCAFDPVTQTLYAKSSGTWSVLAALGSGGNPTLPFSTSIAFNARGESWMQGATVSGPISFTPNLVNAVLGSTVNVTLISNGSNVPTFDGFSLWANSFPYANSEAGLVNTVSFWYDGVAPRYSISPPAVNQSVIPDTTSPAITGVAVANASPSAVAVTFNEPMNAAVVPSAAAFAVSGHSVTAVAYASATVLNLTVTPAFANGEAARTFAYTQPGSAGLRDVAGNLLATVANLTVANNVQPSDTTPPVVASATVAEGTPGVIRLAFNESMDTAFTPAGSSFTVSDGHTVSGVAWVGQILQVAVTPVFSAGETGRTLAYTQPGTGALRDTAGNLLATLTGQAVSNNIGAAVALTLTPVNGLTQSPSGTWTGGANTGFQNYGRGGALTLAGDGWVSIDLASGTDGACLVGFDKTNTVNFTSNDDAGCPDAYLQISTNTGNLLRGANVATGTVVEPLLTAGPAVRYRLCRTGTTITIDYSTDSGASWSTRYTFAGSFTGTLYVWIATVTGNKIYNPRQVGMA